MRDACAQVVNDNWTSLHYQSDDLSQLHSKLDFHEVAAIANWSCNEVIRRVLRREQILK